MNEYWVLVVFAVLFGAITGSFLNVVIYRTGLKLSEEFAAEAGEQPPGKVRFAQLGSRSVCPSCGARIPFHYNLPVFGWLLLRGKAACCGATIRIRYPFVEAITAAGFGCLVALAQGSPRAEAMPVAAFFLWAFFVADLVANTFIDLDHRILPDKLTRPLLVVGLVGGMLLGPAFAGGLPEDFTTRVSPAIGGLLASGAGALCGWGLTFGIRALGTALFRQEAMGLGDVKLMLAVGAFLGWPGALLTFFLGSLTGAVGGLFGRVVGADMHRIAFGPYLALGALMTLYGGHPLMHFATRTLPEWQAETFADPRAAVGMLVVGMILLIWVVRRGRSRRPEES